MSTGFSTSPSAAKSSISQSVATLFLSGGIHIIPPLLPWCSATALILQMFGCSVSASAETIQGSPRHVPGTLPADEEQEDLFRRDGWGAGSCPSASEQKWQKSSLEEELPDCAQRGEPEETYARNAWSETGSRLTASPSLHGRCCGKEQDKCLHLSPWCRHTPVKVWCPSPQLVSSCCSHLRRLVDQADFAVIPLRDTSAPITKQIQRCPKLHQGPSQCSQDSRESR